MAEKTAGELLSEKLCYKAKSAYDILSEDQIKSAYNYCKDYMTFLNNAKTERETVSYTVSMLEKAGFSAYDEEKNYTAGQKIYIVNRNKSIIAAVIGRTPLSMGVNIAAAHIDSPRLDLKPNPLYEDNDIALFKTHYYGGIKKYQWTAIPLSLHGVIVKKDGTSITINIGENENDPLFCVTDLLPHLAKDQMSSQLKDAIKGEALNVLVGSRPFKDDKASEKVKLNILNILYERYDITEADFMSAELELVPAFKAVDVGFDRSMIGAYGHDDRVCAYPCITALLTASEKGKTQIAVLADKEETGSDGNTGMSSDFLHNFIEGLCKNAGQNALLCFKRSKCLSADVSGAFDPNYPEVNDKNNASYINKGACITKYTGGGGKYDTSDATAEFFAEIRNILDTNKVVWQTGELGKVDQGGGGTVAKYISKLDIDVLDLGVPVLSMHSPFEVVSKLDVFMTHEALRVFFAQA